MPQAARFEQMAQAAEAKVQAVNKAYVQAQQNEQQLQQTVNNDAVNTYVNQRRAISARNGKIFNEEATRNAATTRVGEIKDKLNVLLSVDPRYNKEKPMLKKGNIVGILKILILVISVCFLLTACSGTDVKGTNNSNQQTAMSGADRSSSQLAKDQRDCWQSSILELMYRQMGSFSLGLYKQMTDGALAFIMVAFAVWFSFRLMRHVSSLQEENIAEVWKEVFKQLFICFVCGLLASSTAGLAFVLNTIIFPLYYTFLEFAGEMLNAASAATGQEDLSLTFLGEKIEYGQKIACVPENLVTDENLTSFPAAPINMMSCIACAIN